MMENGRLGESVGGEMRRENGKGGKGAGNGGRRDGGGDCRILGE